MFSNQNSSPRFGESRERDELKEEGGSEGGAHGEEDGLRVVGQTAPNLREKYHPGQEGRSVYQLPHVGPTVLQGKFVRPGGFRFI